MLGNRYNQHSFAQVPAVNIPRSKFDRSFTAKDTFDFDKIVPIYCEEIYPGDTVNCTANIFARISNTALKVPIMDRMFMDVEFFFVPNRLVWDNWEKFNGAQTDPGDSTTFLTPQVQSTAVTGEAVDSIWDHFGLPIQVAGLSVSALPFRAYVLIWNEWYRDQNRQDSYPLATDNGPDAAADYALLNSCKPHDYFTSGLPWPQKAADVLIPLSSTAPVVSNGNTPNYSGSGFTNRSLTVDGTTNHLLIGGAAVGGVPAAIVGNESGLVADTDALAGTINQLRQAFAFQGLFELDARGGTRYIEILRNHFGVISPDFRLQRPEFLGGGRLMLNTHPVAQTAPTSGGNPQGQLAAFGTGQTKGRDIGYTKSFVEHGWVLGLARARADVTYQQGINRMWSRETRFEYYWPKLQEIGEQATLKKEVFADGTSADSEVFNYQERFGELKYRVSEIRGKFRSIYAQSLDVWHLAEDNTTPIDGSSFIASNTPIERSMAIDTEPQLIVDMWFQQTFARPMATYSVPAGLGRF